ncbi:MAG: hypothetical protein HY266_05320 [Deltaproteobacteria bacterium]|nr:hypothetical protein [Deltaproteobacteria bacterium]
MSLSSKDFQAVLDTVNLIYSVDDRSALFRAVCEKLQKIIGLYSAIFIPADPAGTEAETARPYFNGYEIFDNSEGAMLIYLDYYSTLDPFVTGGWWQTRNRVARNTDLVPVSILRESEFARDFLLPYAGIFYCLGTVLASQGDTVGILGLHRLKSEGDWSDRDKEVFSLLVPHLARAMRNLDIMERNSILTDQRNGIIVIGKDGKLFYMNETAKQIVGKMPLDKIPDPGIGYGPVFFKRKRKGYRVRTVPADTRQKGKMILLERYPANPQMSVRSTRLGLSTREEEVAALVIQGYTNREIAEKLCISGWTVKDHLSEIFEKCKINRRSQLASTLLQVRQ